MPTVLTVGSALSGTISGASVRARLLNLSKESGQNCNLLLTRYALERLLHRLTQTPHRDRFVLKGAMLMTTWFDDPHRSTRDVDLLGAVLVVVALGSLVWAFAAADPYAMAGLFESVAIRRWKKVLPADAAD